MTKIRVACYVDGFNIYHAIDDMSRAQRGALNHLKWLDLRSLMERFSDPNVHDIGEINYFSAYMKWRADREARHKEYVKALVSRGVKPIMGRFKEKDAYCKNCKSVYKAREEKESDVNIANPLSTANLLTNPSSAPWARVPSYRCVRGGAGGAEQHRRGPARRAAVRR
jgi:hypothetical protein